MKFFCSFIFCIATYASFSQAKYAVFLIPDSLKKDARLVSRLDETTLKIKSPGKANLHSHVVFTVLNSAGDTYANMVSPYNKFRIINSIEATLYNAFGKEIRHIKKKDMKDLSGSGDEELMTDTRYKQFDFLLP